MSIFDKRIPVVSLIGYDFDYKIDEDGNLYKNNKRMKGSISVNGYHRYALRVNNKFKRMYTHRLVAIAFIKNEDISKTLINHKDGNKLNNNVNNLEWCNHYENNHHAIKNNLNNISGENHFNHKLKDIEIKNIRKLFKEGKSKQELSTIYKVTVLHISRIINRTRRNNVNI